MTTNGQGAEISIRRIDEITTALSKRLRNLKVKTDEGMVAMAHMMVQVTKMGGHDKAELVELIDKMWEIHGQ